LSYISLTDKRQLGIPTANIPLEGLEIGGHSDLESGVYYGWAGLHSNATNNTKQTVYPMVMSIGWNPFYGNTVRSVVSTIYISDYIHAPIDTVSDYRKYMSSMNLGMTSMVIT
jgi:FAD synthase